MGFLEVAVEVVEAAGEIAVKYFGQNLDRDFKQDKSFATQADLEAEQAMRKIIELKYPNHDILGEELGDKPGESEFQWILDPIDGTRNYSFGVPRYTCAAALLHQGDLVFSAILDPSTQELFTAEVGRGAKLNGQELKIGDTPPLSTAIIAFGRGRADRSEFHKLFARIEPEIGSPRIMGSSLLMMTEVARGRFGGMITTIDNIWDMAAGVLLVRAVGGMALNFNGEQWTTTDKEVVLGSKEIAQELVAFIKSP
ncbi:inositol monophosphatase [Candidatus Berkelbacteria bacterium]|nr:inositol monophosphatase [Candidatus Berkelbacteria bacterium]